MNTNMFVNPIVQDNLDKLRHFGYEVVDPVTGYLACGDTGQGKMPEPKLLLEYILKEGSCREASTGHGRADSGGH